VDQSDTLLLEKMANKLIRVIFYIAVVYFNLLVLFPKYLKKNKFYLYTALLIITVVILTPIESFFHYLLFFRKVSLAEMFQLDSNSKIFLGSFFMAFSSTLYKIINDWAFHQNEKIDLKRQSLQSELNFLKSQINPHFLFNTLNSLYALTLKKSDKAPEIVLRLSEMMRYMLYECNESKVPLSSEIQYIKNYLELEKLRHGKSFNIQLNIDGDANGQLIAPLIFIPFLENSFKHGIDHHIDEGFVNINIDIVDSKLSLFVENSKSKIQPKKKKNSGGIGLVNVKRRLDLVYPNKHELNLTNNEDAFNVSLSLDLSNN
jgi:LytS/YehU family sensor histidine kinase